MDPEEYRREIEKEIRRLMEDKLTSGTMNGGRASEIADYILSNLHPHMTFTQIHELSKNFDEHFSELVPNGEARHYLYLFRSNLTGCDGGVSSPSVDLSVSQRGDDTMTRDEKIIRKLTCCRKRERRSRGRF